MFRFDLVFLVTVIRQNEKNDNTINLNVVLCINNNLFAAISVFYYKPLYIFSISYNNKKRMEHNNQCTICARSVVESSYFFCTNISSCYGMLKNVHNVCAKQIFNIIHPNNNFDLISWVDSSTQQLFCGEYKVASNICGQDQHITNNNICII